MARTLIRSPKFDIDRSLGWLAVWWIENFVLVGGSGSVKDDLVRLGDEYAGFVVDGYALDENGERAHDSAFFSRPKGSNKSGLAAYISLFEAFGPCRFAGWAEGGETYTFLGKTYEYLPGEPMGKSMTKPFVRIMATAEDQASNVYDTVLQNAIDGPLADLKAYGMDPALGRIVTPDGGKIMPSSSGDASKDGGLETFVVFDEALALSTPLPTPTGWTTMGEVRVGDELIGSDGKPVKVIKTTDIMEERDVYHVLFRDGTSFTASDGHLWETRVTGSQAKPRIRTTGEMFCDGRKFSVPAARPLQTPDVDLPIDPYVFGLWLGDGDKSNATIATSPEDIEQLEELITARGYTVKRCAAYGGQRLVYVSVPGSHKNRFSKVKGLLVRLRELGVLGRKHIPDLYLRAGTRQREELLRGLMDSDGYCAPNGHVTLTGNNYELIDDAAELMRSLGQMVGVSIQEDARASNGTMCRLSFKPRWGLVPFAFKRKVARLSGKPMTIRDEWTSIASITKAKSVPVKCVAVDSDDHLFLAGDGWKVTHNTHIYTTPTLHSMYDTVRRNLAKNVEAHRQKWSLETTTMYQPGENSVAEQTYDFAKLIQEGRARNDRLLFDHRFSAMTDAEFTDNSDEGAERLRAAVVEALGEAAGWNDVDTILNHIYDPRNDVRSSKRYFLNDIAAPVDAWIEPAQLEPLLADKQLRPGDKITLGFDGAVSKDATALVACRISDGLLVPLRIDECPDGAEALTWRVDQQAFDAAVADAFDLYDVVGFFADPPFWQDWVAKWENEYGTNLQVSAGKNAIEFYTNRDSLICPAVERLHTDVLQQRILFSDRKLPSGDSLPMDVQFRRHFINARSAERRGGTVIYKESQKSPKKIDAAMAGILAWAARGEFLDEPVKPKKKFVPMYIRG